MIKMQNNLQHSQKQTCHMNVKKAAASHNLEVTFHMLVSFAKNHLSLPHLPPVFIDETKKDYVT